MHHSGETKIVKYPIERLILTNKEGKNIILFDSLKVEKGPAFTNVDDAIIAFWDHLAGVNPFQLKSDKEFLEENVRKFLEGDVTLNQLRLLVSEF